MSHFMHAPEVYFSKKSMNPKATYRRLMEKYISKIGGDTVKPEKVFMDTLSISSYKDPKVTFYERDAVTFDKEKTSTSLSTYLSSAEKEDLVILPSLSCYRKDVLSLDAKWTKYNVALRNTYKERAKAFEQKKDMVNYSIQNSLQKAKKTKNNALSGTYSLENSPLHTHSAHYALTSLTRVTSSVGNILTERLIGGNRFYRLKDDVIAEFLNYMDGVDRGLIAKAIKTYDLHIPTVDNIMEMVVESSKWYWEDESYLEIIREFVVTLDSIDLCAILYAQDLFFMFKYNNNFITTFFKKLTRKVSNISDDIEIIKKGDYDIMNSLHMMHFDELKGAEVKYDLYKGKDIGWSMVSTYINMETVLEEYELYIKAFFKEVYVIPINTQYVKEMVRNTIVLSDTDSTCGAFFKLVQKEDERFILNGANITRIAGLILILSGNMNHALKLYVANTNAEPELYNEVSMKAEFLWSIFLPALVAKHYLTAEIIKEMFIRPASVIDVSGVNLIASSLPPFYQDKFTDFRSRVVEKLESGGLLSVGTIIRELIFLENEILENLDGDIKTVLRSDKIKTETAYKNDWKKSNFLHHKLWVDVFAKKYGNVSSPPYRVFKIPLTTNTKSKTMLWLDSLDDKNIADKFKAFLLKAGKNDLGMIRIPQDIILSKGAPKELRSIMDEHAVVNQIMSPFYSLVDSLGLTKYSGKLFKEIY